MKLTTYLLAIFFMVVLFSSCTSDDAVEEGLQIESQSRIEYGEDEIPMDNDKVR
jgi:hypothetical protein